MIFQKWSWLVLYNLIPISKQINHFHWSCFPWPLFLAEICSKAFPVSAPQHSPKVCIFFIIYINFTVHGNKYHCCHPQLSICLGDCFSIFHGCDELSNLAPSIHPSLAQKQSKSALDIKCYFNLIWGFESLLQSLSSLLLKELQMPKQWQLQIKMIIPERSGCNCQNPFCSTEH